MDNAPFYISLGHRTAAVAPTLAHNTGLTVIIGGLFSIIILGLWWLTRRWHPKHLQAPWWVALLVALMLGLLAGTLLGVRAAASGPVTAYSLGGTWHLHFPLDNHRYFVAITADHNGSLSGGNGGGGHYQQDWDTGYPDTDTIEALVSDGAFDDNQLDGTCSSPAYPATGNAASDFSCALAYANTKGISFDLLTAVGGSSTATSSTTRLVTIPHITVSQSSRVFTIQLSYHEAMNPAVAPIISYGADLSSALTFNSGVWTADNTIYLATSTITGVRNITGIVATVSGGQAQADGAAPATTAGAPFNIDTRLPIITLWGPATMTIAHHATLFDPLAGAVSGSGATLTVSASGAVDTSTVGAYSVVYTIADAYGNTASTTRTMQVADTTAGQMALQTNTALTSTVSQAIVTPNNIAPAIITIASDAVSPSLNVASVMSGTAAVMPGSITAQATLSGNNVTAFIPAGAHISTADASAWDSIINLPQQGDSSLAPSSGGGTTYAMSSAVEFGHGTLALVSTLPVSLRFAGQAGRFAAWSHGGSFHPITITCNDATNPTNLSADGNCVISVAGDTGRDAGRIRRRRCPSPAGRRNPLDLARNDHDHVCNIYGSRHHDTGEYPEDHTRRTARRSADHDRFIFHRFDHYRTHNQSGDHLRPGAVLSASAHPARARLHYRRRPRLGAVARLRPLRHTVLHLPLDPHKMAACRRMVGSSLAVVAGEDG